MINLKKHYTEIRPKLKDSLSLKSIMEVPVIYKISLNMGIGEAMSNRKVLDQAAEEMRIISGQMPIITKAKKSIAGFKLREDYPIGCKVTLRNDAMWNFLEKAINVALPRIRDFRGLKSTSFDKFGNYSFGIKEQLIFPEIEFDKVDKIRGMDIAISIKSKSPEHSLALLNHFNFPFEKNN